MAARDNNPAYSAPDAATADTNAVPADATGERTAENTDQGVVTEAQADQGSNDTEVKDAQVADNNVSEQEELARMQAEEDAQARYQAEKDGTFVHREANPDIGGESFPTFAPQKK